MARKPTVRWSESAQRWMAWVRFPDGTRRKVERVSKADAQQDLERLLVARAESDEPVAGRKRLATFDEVLDAWIAAGCPTAAPTSRTRHAREKSPNTIENARILMARHVRPAIGKQWVDRTSAAKLESLFRAMSAKGLSTSSVDRAWLYLNQCCAFGVKQGLTRSNPADGVLLPAAKPRKERKSLSIEQAQRLLVEGIPADSQPAMWLTGLMCGLRPGELVGLRWPFVDIDSEEPSIEVAERALTVEDRYAGQAAPKTERGKRRMALHPLLVAALTRHRMELDDLGLYDPEGFVFPTSRGTAQGLPNVRRAFKRVCENAGLGRDWTTYELRHSFVSLVSDQLDDLVKVADLAGHVDTRTTQGYRHKVCPSLPHAVEAWDRLLASVELRSGPG